MTVRKYDFLYDEKTYADIPCQLNCPVHTDVQEYVHLISKEKFAEAHALIRETNPFPSVCARVCQHPCETGCNREKLDMSVSIRTLKRAATDLSEADFIPPPKTYPTLEKIAVVGAGPAGLTAAYDLARLGYRVTVFEAEAHPGGMLRYGIPSFRLPREVIDKETEMIKRAGVDIRYNMRVGRDVTLNELRAEHKAVLLAAGAWDPTRLNVPGEDYDGVYHGTTFMYRVNSGDSIPLMGKKVVVVGGGFTAMDVSRTAVRLGASEVHIVYRRTKEEIPVMQQEITESEEEGVIFHYLVSPLEVVSKDGKTVSGLKLIKNELGEPDSSGRRRPVPIKGSEYVMDCDVVAPAVSQSPSNECLNDVDDVVLSKWGTLEVDGKTRMSNIEGVFGCGDFTEGAQHAIKVIADGHEAAVSIDTYLRGESAQMRGKEREGYELYDADEPNDKEPQYDAIERRTNGVIVIDDRINTFLEVETGFTVKNAVAEANRCFQCNYIWTFLPEYCIMCANCVDVCPQDCLTITPLTELQHNRWLNEDIGLKEQGVTGIVINNDLCIRCAFCKAVCPTDSITFSCYGKEPKSVASTSS
jgi:NADPH-dependent glutamate synthase beta subunit-like oxidoreductase/NAD-dependent dihydropyrimidine dehydrogenase PreA subunit